MIEIEMALELKQRMMFIYGDKCQDILLLRTILQTVAWSCDYCHFNTFECIVGCGIHMTSFVYMITRNWNRHNIFIYTSSNTHGVLTPLSEIPK